MNFLLSILTQRLWPHPSRCMMRLGFTSNAEGKGVLRTYKLNLVPHALSVLLLRTRRGSPKENNNATEATLHVHLIQLLIPSLSIDIVSWSSSCSKRKDHSIAISEDFNNKRRLQKETTKGMRWYLSQVASWRGVKCIFHFKCTTASEVDLIVGGWPTKLDLHISIDGMTNA